MKKNNSFKWIFTVLLILTVAVYFGCDKKTEENGNKDNSTIETKIPDITGKWTGVFDGKTAVLDITDQTDSSFSGKITISYRQVINQEVKGAFSPTTLTMSMTDQLHSRYQGVYNGSLSKEADNFSGTFTMDQDGSKYSFNLNKK
ncbi:MAG TPA: hypothetical protein VLH59_00385 [Ignavibacteriaceae bacterium]|nr:hypothetical protein [Ignavibacteriaceae bacterium]